jgi:hypothetical protein
MHLSILSAIVASSVVVCGTGIAAAASYSADFEAPTYTVDTAIGGQAGWVDSDTNALVRDASYGGGFGSNGQHLVVNGANNIAESPSFSLDGSRVSNVSYDFRPGDAAVSNGHSAGTMYLFDSSMNMMLSLDFRSDGNGSVSQGYIFATYGNAYFNTTIPWSYVDNNTSYHIDITVDSDALTWSASINNAPAITGDFGGVFGFNASTGDEAGKIWFRGGQNNNPGGLVAYDNLVVTAVPEPAAASLLLVGGAMLLRRRRGC